MSKRRGASNQAFYGKKFNTRVVPATATAAADFSTGSDAADGAGETVNTVRRFILSKKPKADAFVGLNAEFQPELHLSVSMHGGFTLSFAEMKDVDNQRSCWELDDEPVYLACTSSDHERCTLVFNGIGELVFERSSGPVVLRRLVLAPLPAHEFSRKLCHMTEHAETLIAHNNQITLMRELLRLRFRENFQENLSIDGGEVADHEVFSLATARFVELYSNDFETVSVFEKCLERKGLTCKLQKYSLLRVCRALIPHSV